MKKRTKLYLSLLMMLSAAVTSCSIEDNNPVDPIDPYDSEEGGVYNPNAGSAPEGVVAVDLGLPSGTKWANMNVGAEDPGDDGLYFAWGETTGYTGGHSFNWASYKWCNGSYDSMTKYCTNSSYGSVDNKTVLDPEDDAAHANWGGDWRMPTLDEIQELLDNTTSRYWNYNGVNGATGRRFTSKKNGKSIFLPYAGYYYGTSFYGWNQGRYWSASLSGSNSSNACRLGFDREGAGRNSPDRYFGFTVRPVLRKAPTAPVGVVAVDLGLPSGTKWANMNVGATSPEDYGLYFAWGETIGYTDGTTDSRSFNWASYKWMEYAQMNKYQEDDGKTVLDLEDDAAHANWGGDWRMPTFDEIEELLDNTTSEWTTVNGINGRKFTSKTNGNSVFLPVAGYRSGTSLSYQGQEGHYWSSSLYEYYTVYARYLTFYSLKAYWGHNFNRYVGLPVRPVLRN